VPSQTPDDAAAISCDQFSIDLDPALASNYTCEDVAEFDDEYMGNPQYIWIGLEGYPLSGEYLGASISVYPVEEFAAMVPDPVVGMVSDLEALTSGGATPDDLFPPYLFSWDAANFFYAQYAVVPFADGDGVRYLTGFTQDMGVFDNPVLYTYQAMTDDGRYWISADFPISHPLLPTDATWPPDGMTLEEWSAIYDTYITDNVNQLNAQSPSSFTPSIDDLDALVASITIAP
jgi:hypothetical protein